MRSPARSQAVRKLPALEEREPQAVLNSGRMHFSSAGIRALEGNVAEKNQVSRVTRPWPALGKGMLCVQDTVSTDVVFYLV